MPDWSYIPVFRPVLFRLPVDWSRTLALGAMGTLGRFPGGKYVIDLMGHMHPDGRLARTVGGIRFPSPVGLGPALDGHASALSALGRFGFGFIEVGPATIESSRSFSPTHRHADREAIEFSAGYPRITSSALREKLQRARLPLPVIVRLGLAPGTPIARAGEQILPMVEEFRPHASMFSLDVLPSAEADAAAWTDMVAQVVAAARVPVLLVMPAEFDDSRGASVVATAVHAGIKGVIVDGSIPATSGRICGIPARAMALKQVAQLRDRFGPSLVIIAGGGIHVPADALQFLAAGADLIQTDTGLIFSGPGLPKRINESILARTPRSPTAAPAESNPPQHHAIEPRRAPEMMWFWTMLLGSALLIGGFLALIFAATRVVLPYDESFVGLHRDQFDSINPRLLAFMAHDRVSVAGTLLASGVFFVMLSYYAIRHGVHWASVTVLTAGFAGFASFFLFLGFGYFDPFHAMVTAINFQFILLALRSKLGPPPTPRQIDDRNDSAWRLSQWGQLLFVVHGVSLLSAGLTISAIGSTSVFVKEDLMFMHTTASAIEAANPRLVPLVAHDRASFGGMLIVSGIVVTLSALWGFRRGERWLWWMYLMGLGPAYLCAIGVHFVVGYNHFGHLFPAFSGAALLVMGLILTRPFLLDLTRSASPEPS